MKKNDLSQFAKNSEIEDSESLADLNASEIFELNLEIEKLNRTQVHEFVQSKCKEISQTLKKQIQEMDQKRLEELNQKSKNQQSSKESSLSQNTKTETKYETADPEFIQFLNKLQDYIINVRQLTNTKHLERTEREKLDRLLNLMSNPITSALSKKNWIFVSNDPVNKFLANYLSSVFQIREILTKIIQAKSSLCCNNGLDDLKKQLKGKMDELESRIWAFPIIFQLEPRNVTMVTSQEPEKVLVLPAALLIDEKLIAIQIGSAFQQGFPELQATYKLKIKNEVQFIKAHIEKPEVVEKEVEKVVFHGPVIHKGFIQKEDNNKLVQAHECFYGLGRTKDYSSAVRLYKQCQNEGSAVAITCLGKIQLEGIGISRNNEKAAELFSKAAEMGENEAIYQLGKMYKEGLILSSEKIDNLKESSKYFEKAAGKNHSEAITDLGFIHEKGLLGKVDEAKAEELYERGVGLENARAMNNLASLLLARNPLDSKTQKRAFDLFEKAAGLGSALAQTNLGICYVKGIHVSKDYIAAKQLFTQANQKNDADALFYLTYFQLKEMQQNSSEDGYHLAGENLRRVLVVNPNHADALYYLGYLYENGFGVSQDPKTALHFYSRSTDASNGKDGKSLYKTANMIYNGNVSEYQNKAKAVSLYHRAAELGDCDAAYVLGVLYEEGADVDQNKQTAQVYYNLAARNGNMDAQFNLALMKLTKLPDLNGQVFNGRGFVNTISDKTGLSYEETGIDEINPENLIIDAANKGNKRALNYLQRHSVKEVKGARQYFSTLPAKENQGVEFFGSVKTFSEKKESRRTTLGKGYTGLLQQFMVE